MHANRDSEVPRPQLGTQCMEITGDYIEVRRLAHRIGIFEVLISARGTWLDDYLLARDSPAHQVLGHDFGLAITGDDDVLSPPNTKCMLEPALKHGARRAALHAGSQDQKGD